MNPQNYIALVDHHLASREINRDILNLQIKQLEKDLRKHKSEFKENAKRETELQKEIDNYYQKH